MKIGSEVVAIKPEAKKALDVEIFLRNLAVFAVVLAYALDFVSVGVFLVLLYLAYARFFIGNHDRFHTNAATRWPRWFEALSETFQLGVVPWVEPYDSIRRKHMTHHATHRPGKTPVLDTRRDPHSAFENYGFLRSFLSCLFWEEGQLYYDIRNGTFTRSRWVNLAVYLSLDILFFIAFGWQKYLIVLAATRALGGFFWFFFSWISHRPPFYRFGFKNRVPRLFQWLFGFANGKRSMDGLFRHTSHHAWPRVPSSDLDKFDSAVLRNPDAAPALIPSG
jgi:fatty acid desaturase